MSRSGDYQMVTQEVERLKDEGRKATISGLARRLGLSRNTVRKYLKEGFKPHASKGTKRGSVLDPYKGWLQEQFKAGNYNSESLLAKLQERGYRGGRSTLKAYVKGFRPPEAEKSRPQRVMRYETRPGDQAQLDWGFVSYVDTRGREKRYACMVMVLGHSRARYIEFFTQASSAFLHVGIVHALEYFGGVPRRILTDNMRSVVLHHGPDGIVMNPAMEAFASEMGFTVGLCKIRCPQTKGKVERLVHYVKNNFMPGTEFCNLVELNEKALAWCERVNGLRHGSTGLVPSEQLALERKSLRPLPPRDVRERYLWQERRIGIDGFVSYEGLRLGVDRMCVGRSVRVLRDGGRVIAVDGQGLLACAYDLHGTRRVYLNPEQWPQDYRSYSMDAGRSYAPGIQRKAPGSVGLFDLSEYDRIARGEA